METKSTSKTVDEIEPIKEKFIKEYDHFWCTEISGGINAIGIGIGDDNSGELGIAVYIESNDDVYNKIPDQYDGVKVHKIKIGIVSPY